MALSENAEMAGENTKNTPTTENTKAPSNDSKKERPLTKIIIRRLPPSITKEAFLEQVSPVPDYDYLYVVKGDMSLGENAFSRVYVNFVNAKDVFIFKEKFDNYVFVDGKGHEYPAVVEFAAFQKIPKRRSKFRVDPKCNTIETDPTYLEFLESLKEQPAGDEEEKPEFSYQPSADTKKDTTTPLLEFIRQRKMDKQRIREEKREERRKREMERKKLRDEDRRKRRGDSSSKDASNRSVDAKEDTAEKKPDKTEKEYKSSERGYKKHTLDDRKVAAKSKSKLTSNVRSEAKLTSNVRSEAKLTSSVRSEPKLTSSNVRSEAKLTSNVRSEPKLTSSNVRSDAKLTSNVRSEAKLTSNVRSEKSYDRKSEYKKKDESKSHKYGERDTSKRESSESHKPVIKKVKKYSERREERKIEAQKAEQKKTAAADAVFETETVTECATPETAANEPKSPEPEAKQQMAQPEINEDSDGSATGNRIYNSEPSLFQAEETVPSSSATSPRAPERRKSMDESKSDGLAKKENESKMALHRQTSLSEEMSEDCSCEGGGEEESGRRGGGGGASSSKRRNKENDPRTQRRIRNKDRPTMQIYKPGMLSKRRQSDNSEDSKN